MDTDQRRLRRRCIRATHRPRFDGAAAYVPYFWWAAGAGRRAARLGDVLAFEVDERDRRLFPELGRATVVALRVTNGLVHED